MAFEVLRIRRRITGAAGAPGSLQDGELAFNEVDGILYYGSGVNAGDGITALTILAVGGLAKAGVNSPAFTGIPTAPTPAASTNTTQLATTAFVLGQAATTAPVADGAATIGTSFLYARQDHVHPTDGTRAALASPVFTGTPTAPTALVSTNTLQLATTAFVLAQAGTAAPLVNAATAVVGTSFLYARQDHVHPTDGTRAALASPALTGTPTAPTAAVSVNTTQLATTAFVLGQAGTATPLTTGTAAVGTSFLFARQDHTHPADTTRQAALGFTPVQQGTGTGQLTNAVKLGWSSLAKLKVTVDVTDLGNIAMESWVLGGAYSPAQSVVDAEFYPLVASIDPTGAADSSGGIQNAIARAAAAGGGTVVLPAGIFKIGTTLTNTKSGVRMRGAGRGAFHDVTPYAQAGTLLVWGGAVGGTMMTVGPVVSASSQKLTDAGVVDVAFQGSADYVTAGAAYGLIVTSTQHSTFDVYTIEFTTAGLAFSVVTSAIAEAANCEGNTVSLRFRQINQTGTALQFTGSAQGNSCFFNCPFVYGYMKNGIGIDFANCDNITVQRAWVDRVSGGTGYNLYFRSDANQVAGGCARVNVIQEMSASVHTNAIYAEGLEKAGATTASYGNRIERFDNSNTTPNVIVGTGVSFYYSLNTAPIGMRESAVNAQDGHIQWANGIIDFWGVAGSLNGGTVSTVTIGSFGCSRILDISANVYSGTTPASIGVGNFSGRSDGALNKFDITPSITCYVLYRGKALA